MTNAANRHDGLFAPAWREARGTLIWVGLFSAVINLLGLTGPLYMLQIYDRVLASRSVSTLVAVSVLCLATFILLAVLDILRARVLSAMAANLERSLLAPIHELVLRLPLAGRTPAEVAQPLRDLETVRGFLGGPGPGALLDLPWVAVYLGFVFALSPWLGLLTIAGMAALLALALLTEARLRAPSLAHAMATSERFQTVEMARRNVESIRAMGMDDAVRRRFFANARALMESESRLHAATGVLGGLSKSVRLILQSAILGLGAYLVLQGRLSAGSIIACSIIAGRALAPIEQLIGTWRGAVGARQASRRLREAGRLLPQGDLAVDHPKTSRTLAVQGVVVGAPGANTPIVRGVSFELKAGDRLAIIGPSGAGKSTLLRGIAGAWPAMGGVVRLDGVPLEHHPRAALGGIIGYLPQAVELFDGTVFDNIARLDPEAADADVIEAGRAAGAHEMIVKLPAGYKTRIGDGQFQLSSGQRQRIGLARALFRNPFLIVMDEPNAHLDQEGNAALAGAVRGIGARGGIAVIVSHRADILDVSTHVAQMEAGVITRFSARAGETGNAETAPSAYRIEPAYEVTTRMDASRGTVGRGRAGRKLAAGDGA